MRAQPDWNQADDGVQVHARFLLAQARHGVLPECAIGGICEDCPLVSLATCPLAFDVDFMALLDHYNEEYADYERLKERRLRALTRVLRRHKLAMHGELIARIVNEAEPGLFPNDKSVLATLAHHPEFFFEETPGAYCLAPLFMAKGEG